MSAAFEILPSEDFAGEHVFDHNPRTGPHRNRCAGGEVAFHVFEELEE